MNALEHGINPVLGGILGAVGAGVVAWFGIVAVSRLAGGSFAAFIQPRARTALVNLKRQLRSASSGRNERPAV